MPNALFQSQAARFVEQSLVRAKWDAEAERMTEAANRLDLYSDDYKQIILDTLKTLFHKDNYARLYLSVNGTQNLLKRVINELSMVYKTEATRTLSVESDRWDEIQAETDIDTRMKRVNRLTNLVNDIIIKVGIRGGKMAYDIITPDICSITQDPEDPTRIQSIMWLRTSVNTPSSSEVEYEYMDDLGYWLVLNKDFAIKQTYFDPSTYPYKDAEGRVVLPLVVVHRQHPECAFWDQDSGRDLYDAAVQMGVKMTLIDYYIKTASFKQPYVLGADVPTGQVMDVTTFLKVPVVDPNTHPEIGVLDLQPQLPALIEALTYQLNSVINNYGISADMWTLSINEMSGRALKIKNRALLEQREEQIPTYRAAEEDLFFVTRIVNNAHASYMGWETIPEEAELEVDFAEVEFPEDPVYELDLSIKKLECGLLSPGKFYQRDNPDITDEKEAEKAWVDNLNKTKALRQANPTLDEALNAIMQGGKKPEDENQFGKGKEGAF